MLNLSWGENSVPPSLISPPLDFILAAECIYVGRAKPLLETLYAAAGANTEVLICGIVGEGSVESFQALVGNYFAVTVVPNVRTVTLHSLTEIADAAVWELT